ncbi:MAG: hypothetical protein CMK23_01000 [Porticoccaceae bacterium]|nr:hypothetical protein [Porticoccaceae bacterium]|tara:strand:- start:298 stop:525 length:228 start_codon:yes stop_codon:yes gene_type:complete
MSRKTFPKPTKEYDEQYMNRLVSDLEQSTTLILEKGSRIEANSNDSTEIVLVSPNGTKYKLEVSDAGTISTTQVV